METCIPQKREYKISSLKYQRHPRNLFYLRKTRSFYTKFYEPTDLGDLISHLLVPVLSLKEASGPEDIDYIFTTLTCNSFTKIHNPYNYISTLIFRVSSIHSTRSFVSIIHCLDPSPW